MEQARPAGDVYVDVRLAAGANVALEHLRDEGYRVVLVGDAPHPTPADGGGPVPQVATLPGDATGWLVTADASVCTGARELRHLRTILVGPTVQGRGLAHRPADAEARDLLDAVLTILAAGAMPADVRAG